MTLKFNEFIFESTKDTKRLKQIINVLSKSEFPLTYQEICDEINSVGEIQIPRSSYRSVLTQIIGYTKEKQDTKSAKSRNKSGKVFFELVSERPQKFKLSEDFDMTNTENIESDQENKYYLLGAYDENIKDWWKQCVEEGKWYNGFALGGDSRLDDKVNEIPVGANVAIKSTYLIQRTQPVMMIKARGVVTKNYEDGTQLDVEWEKDFTSFEMVRNDVGGYRATLHEVSNQEHIDLIWNSYEDELLEDEDDLIDDGDEEDEKVPSFRESLLLEFWTIFRSEISKSTNLFNRRSPSPKIYYGSSTGLSKISFFCVASSRYSRVELYFNKKNPDENKELFDYFLSRKDELENNFGDKLVFERLDGRRASRIKYEVSADVYEQNNWPKIIDFLKTNFLKLVETFQPIINEIVSDPSIVKSRIIPASAAISKKEKPTTYVKNPFGCKQQNGDETSTLCILGKSGTGKTTTTEEVLESMGHECLLYIPIEGEYTFSQYTGKEFEMSSLGEFVMRAQNDPSIYYTVIFDECHRPITISKLNTDLLQALSSRRNRGGERFFTMDRSTKRMYTESSEYPLSLKEKSGKILVPDNFGIVCLSSQPAVICRNEDFLNRVDIAVFTQNDRNINDLNQLIKLESGQKNIETIRGLLVSDGREQ
jgi:effector-binding domain-containing protein